MTSTRDNPAPGVLVDVLPVDRSVLATGAMDGDEAPPELLVVPVFVDERPLLGMAGFLDWRLCGRLSALLRSGFGTAERGERVLLAGHGKIPFPRVVLLGAGPSDEFDQPAAESMARQAVDLGGALRAATLAVAVPANLIAREQCEQFGLALGQRLLGRPDSSSRSWPGVFEWVRVYVPSDGVARFRRLIAGPPRAAIDVD
ncbi:MAG: hypothetical protein B7733_17680 [Myxococcales bacterium FL481]|nr:MAG: hypothetical protein B7733_17680 [Myxococcales bacterium FL481]